MRLTMVTSIILFIAGLFSGIYGVYLTNEGLYEIEMAKQVEERGLSPEWVAGMWVDVMIAGRIKQVSGLASIVGATACFSLASLVVVWGRSITKTRGESKT